MIEKNLLNKIFEWIKDKFIHIRFEPFIYLEVPYSEKDDAKKLGAKWDPSKKKWFIKNDESSEHFKKWILTSKLIQEKQILQDNQAYFRADFFYLALTETQCYKCNKIIDVYAVIIPEGFETIDHYALDDLEEKGIFNHPNIYCRKNYLSMLSYITYISKPALEKINHFIPEKKFKKVYSYSTQSEYYRSICLYCDGAQGDNFLINEFNSVFHPIHSQDLERIKFYIINQEIKVDAGGNSEGYIIPKITHR